METAGGGVEAYKPFEDKDSTSIQETEAHLNLIVSNGDTLDYQSQTELNSGQNILDIEFIRGRVERLFGAAAQPNNGSKPSAVSPTRAGTEGLDEQVPTSRVTSNGRL